MSPLSNNAHQEVEPPFLGASAVASVSPEGPTEARVRVGFESPSERRRVMDWLGSGLRPENSKGLPFEYPFVFDRDASCHFFTIWQGARPASFCALWPARFDVAGAPLRTGMISFVYTDPHSRGRGLARRVIEAASQAATELDLGLLLLWSDLDGLYAPLGFCRAGTESVIVLTATALEGALAKAHEGAGSHLPVLVEAPATEDWNAIERIRDARTSRLRFPAGELSRFRSVPKMNVRVARSERGVEAFAICGRGDDFESVIHEWGGETEGALRCCQALLQDISPASELLLISPDSRESLPWALRKAGARHLRQDHCWMRVASPTALSEDLAGLLRESVRLTLSAPTRPTHARGELQLESDLGETKLSPGLLLRSLFGSIGKPIESEADRRALAPLGEVNLSSLPLPFFAWGLESI